MLRTIEWLLATLGAGVSIAVALIVLQAQPPDPGPSFVLAGTALAGFLGFVAVALNTGTRSRWWGGTIWFAAGILTALIMIGAWSFGPFLILPALAFVGAGLLGDRRRRERVSTHLGVYVTGALGTAVVIVLVNAIGWL